MEVSQITSVCTYTLLGVCYYFHICFSGFFAAGQERFETLSQFGDGLFPRLVLLLLFKLLPELLGLVLGFICERSVVNLVFAGCHLELENRDVSPQRNN